MSESIQTEQIRNSSTGKSEDSAGIAMQSSQSVAPRIRSAPRDIIRSSSPPRRVHNNENMEEQRSYSAMALPLAQKIESRLHWLIEQQERRNEQDRDDGYNSGDHDEWDNAAHGRVFYMDEDLHLPPMQSEDDEIRELNIRAVPFPVHLIEEVHEIKGPVELPRELTVQEYEEMTGEKRCRHSGNRKVHPRDLNSLYSRVSDCVKRQIMLARLVPAMPEPPLPPVIPEDEETPGMRYMRLRLIEQRRRNLLRGLADDLPPMVQDHEVPQLHPKGYDPRPVDPLSSSPEPSTMFAFDEDELNNSF